jgi:hypothetical protein
MDGMRHTHGPQRLARRGADGSGRAWRLRTSILLAGEFAAERRVRCGPCPGQLLGLAV